MTNPARTAWERFLDALKSGDEAAADRAMQDMARQAPART